MTWAFKRQIFYVIVVILFFSGLAFLIIYPKVSKEATCTDGRQNGTETGIDCGGSCLQACLVEQDDLSILWARAFKVVPGRYNAVAYVANYNKSSAVRKISYRFRFGDENNIYIGKREGTTFIPAGGNFAVFEPAIDIGYSLPVYTTFEFTSAPDWLQVPEEKINQLKVLVSNVELSGENTAPRLSATIRNNSLFTIKNLNLVAILYGVGGNAISVSRTYVETFGPLEVRDIAFTWPEPFEVPVTRKEIIPVFDIFGAKLE